MYKYVIYALAFCIRLRVGPETPKTSIREDQILN